MSYKAEIQSNNADLQTVLDKVNALPDAEDSADVNLPALTNPASASDIAEGKEAIDADGNVFAGTVVDVDGEYYMSEVDLYKTGDDFYIEHYPEKDILVRSGSSVIAQCPGSVFGDATPADVAAGKTFTSAAGLKVTGTASTSSGNDDSSAVDAIVDGTITELRSNATIVREHAFYSVSSLVKVDLLQATRMPAMAFYQCASLSTLILRSPTVCTLVTTSALLGTAIAKGNGYIYVPAALIDDGYTTATNWSTYAAQIRAIEDYPDICGG